MSIQDQQAALAEAWSGTVTPYSQIKETLGLDPGDYDFLVGKLEPQLDKNGLYCVAGEFPVSAPAGFPFPYKRTLYIGTKKDPLAKLPETRLNSPGLRFLKQIAKANEIPTNDQSDASLCASIMGRPFSCNIDGTEYEKNGVKVKGSDFGRRVNKVGVVPPRVYGQQANGAAVQPAAATGATFGA